MCAGKFLLVSMGAEQRVKRAQTRERGPPLVPAEIYQSYLHMDSIKGGKAKTPFVFAISQLLQLRNLEIIISTPYNYQGIMWGRDKNFQV